MRINLFALFFSVLLILPILFSSNPVPVSKDATCFGTAISWVIPTNKGNAFGTYLSYAIALMVSVVSIVYALGKFLNKPQLVVWGTTEGLTLVFSIILISIVLAGFVGSCTLAQKYANISEDSNPSFTASTGLAKIDKYFGISVASNLVASSIKDQFDSMKYMYWDIPFTEGGGIAYRAAKKAWSTQKELLVDLYLPIMFSLNAQRMVFELFLPGIVGIILPSAIFFRFFPMTRDVGNFLIALSFAIYIVFPTVYILSFSAVENMMSGVFNGTWQNPFGDIHIAKDRRVGDSFLRIAFIASYIVLIPNLALILTISLTMSINKAFKGFVG